MLGDAFLLWIQNNNITGPPLWSSPIMIGEGAGLTPPQIKDYYNIPACLDGCGQKVMFIEFGGGFSQTDLDLYFHSLGLESPTVLINDPSKNLPTGDPHGVDSSVYFDLCVAIGMANRIKPYVYFADNDQTSFTDAILTAVRLDFDVVCISWGADETVFTNFNLDQAEAALALAAENNITVVASVGFCWSSLRYPSSSTWALAAGGTSLDGGVETAWSGAGGGCSSIFDRPDYQRALGGEWRCTPDVSANADPESGYYIITDGVTQSVGGSSAPFWAALVAMYNQAGCKDRGLINPAFYSLYDEGVAYRRPCVGGCGFSRPFRDIVLGSNCKGDAVPGWDVTTGLGSPNGDDLLAAISDVDKVCCVSLSCEDFNTLVNASLCN